MIKIRSETFAHRVTSYRDDLVLREDIERKLEEILEEKLHLLEKRGEHKLEIKEQEISVHYNDKAAEDQIKEAINEVIETLPEAFGGQE